MTNAIFSEKQPEVKITALDGENYFQICLNEKEIKESRPALGDEEPEEETGYQYDFNSWHDSSTNPDDVKQNPEKYLDYVPSATPTEKTPTLTDRIKALEEQQAASDAALQDLIMMQEG